MQRWHHLDRFFIEEAARDLEAGLAVTPCLAAFRGERPLFVAFVRPFNPGAYAEPLTELLALAAPLKADRLAVSIAGRAWSLEDPIPPVTDDVDLRQRVLVIQRIDGCRRPPRGGSTIVPVDHVDGTMRLGEPAVLDLPEGWIGQALLLTVGSKLHATATDVRRQAIRCLARGHQLALAPDLAVQLSLRATPSSP